MTEQMLRNMFLGSPPGTTARIVEFSTAVTGCLFYVPTADFLDDLPPLPPAAAPDSSLGIGALGNTRLL